MKAEFKLELNESANSSDFGFVKTYRNPTTFALEKRHKPRQNAHTVCIVIHN